MIKIHLFRVVTAPGKRKWIAWTVGVTFSRRTKKETIAAAVKYIGADYKVVRYTGFTRLRELAMTLAELELSLVRSC